MKDDISAILISIRPEFLELACEGIKLYEYRRSRIKINPNIPAYFYRTQSNRGIVARFRATEILFSPGIDVNKLEPNSEVRNRVALYLQNAKNISALKIDFLTLFSKPIPLEYIGVTHPPQSYCFLNEDQHERLCNIS